MQRKSITTNYILNMIKTVAGLIFPVITFAYASRILSVTGIGKVDFSKSIVSYFTLFATLGISTYGIRESAKVRDDRDKLSKLVKELFCINIITTSIAYVFFGSCLLMVPKFVEYRNLLLINGLTIGFTALGLDWLFTAIEDFKYITLRYLLFQIVGLACVFLFVRTESDYYIYALIVAFSSVGSNFYNFVYSKKYINWGKKYKLEIRKHLKPILIFFANTLAGNIYLTLDTSMLGLMSTDYSVGLYSAAIKMTRICVGLVTSLSTILLPRLTFYIHENDIEKYRNILKQSFDCIMLIALPLTIGMFIFSKEILIIFSGEDFSAAIVCARIVSLIILLIPISTFAINQVLVPFGKEKTVLLSTFIGSISNLTVNMMLIPQYGQNGAAIGTVFAEGLVALFTLFFASRQIKLSNILIRTWHYLLATIIMLTAIIPGIIYIRGIWKCFSCAVIGGGVYLGVLILERDDTTLSILKKIKRGRR